MYSERRLSLSEAKTAVEAVLAEASRSGNSPAVAVVDDHGDLICFARGDGAAARVVQRAQGKAYTAAVFGVESATFGEEAVRAPGRTLAHWGDPRVTTLQGGYPIVVEGKVIGAIACAGNSRPRDAELAQVGLAAALRAVGS